MSGTINPRKAPHGRLDEPLKDCAHCQRLVAFRGENRHAHPDWRNTPVPSFGGADARLLVVGLAPGLKGANRTGRPFTGDFAGRLLYSALLEFGFAQGSYGEAADDGLRLLDCRITNAVRCVPPANRPTGEEIRNCRDFLKDEIAGLPRLEAILMLGTVAHGSVLAALGLAPRAYPFRHGAIHPPPSEEDSHRPWLFDSYHCSRLNVNTGRLREAAFREVFQRIRAQLG
jgi:uracil-DNA glycosylase family 4